METTEKWWESRSMKVPNACIDDYYLELYSNTPIGCMKGVVGHIANHTNPKIKIKLIVDTDWMVEHGRVSISLWFNLDNIFESCIVMTGLFFSELRANPCMKFDLWHEVGHFHTLHYFDTPQEGKSSANEVRRDYIESGDVIPEEKAADVFAVYYTSKDAAIEALSESIRKSRMYTWEPSEITQLAIEEYRMRKRFLRDLDSDEKTQKALCTLCGKTNYLEI